MDRVKYTIVGAGAIGLAIAYELSKKSGGGIVVFEKNENFGQETSSRNSEVIHAGIYYIKGSLKSKLCLRGNKLLYNFCRENNIKHKRCGKLIAAVDEIQSKEIEKIYNSAILTGVPDLKLIEPDEIKKLEPDIFAVKAIYSGSTGIIDTHGLMHKLFDLSEKNGAMFSFNNEVKSIKKTAGGYILTTLQGDEILSEFAINSAGLSSDKVAQTAGFDVKKLGYELYYCKGDYFSVSGANGKLSHLVYPAPHDRGFGLGIHATPDLTERIRLGPDAAYVDKIDYDVDSKKANEFYSAAKSYLPWLKEEMVVPDTSGIRPKLQGPNDDIKDFVIKEESDNGFPGFINLIGIESPGLTASLAIAELVSSLISR